MDMLSWNPPTPDVGLANHIGFGSYDVDHTIPRHGSDILDVLTGPTNTTTTKKGPSREEWEHHRPTITRLYLKEDKTLREVMEHMEAVHSFFATKKMYNNRIKIWRIDKNMKKPEALAMLALLLRYKSTGTMPTFTIRGREITQQALLQYARRAHISTRDYINLEPDTIKRTVPQLSWHIMHGGPSQVRAPDEFHRQESLLQALQNYLNGAFESKLCSVSPLYGLEWELGPRASLGDIKERLEDALQNLTENNVTKAGVSLRLAFLWSEDLVHQLDAMEWLKFSGFLSSLRPRQPAITSMLYKHILSFMQIREAESTPQQQFVQSIFSQQGQDVERLYYTCRELILQICTSHTGRAAQLATKIYAQLDIDAQDLIIAESEIPHLLEQLTSCHAITCDAINKICRAVIIISASLGRAGNSRKAKEMLSLLISAIKNLCNADEDSEALWKIAYGMGCMCMISGDWAAAKSHFEDLDKFHIRNVQVFGTMSLPARVLWKCYVNLDWLSNESPIADGDQKWQGKMRAVERQWEDELATKVGSLSLDEVII